MNRRARPLRWPLSEQPFEIDPVPDRRTAADWLERARAAERRGELLLAVDIAESGLAEHPDDVWLAHRAVLCLARSGSTAEAERRFREYGLEAFEDEDIAALGARIAKDQALSADGRERRARAARAAGAYRAIYSRTGGYYPAINAATLTLVAGDDEDARALAREVLEVIANGAEDSYYSVATEAEARLVLGEEAAAGEVLERAAAAADGDYGALATTRRQLRAICAITGADPETLGPLSGPAVVHYCGHRIAAAGQEGRFGAEEEGVAARTVTAEVARHRPGYAYGSLASGGDIIWAEVLLAAGCELHVVLPYDLEEFIRHSVAPSGPAWVERFRRCISEARDVRYATDDAFLGDDVLYRYGAELAMGLALLRARYLDAEARQFALWDGGPAHGEAGTAIDVERWRRSGRAVSIVSPPAGGSPGPGDSVQAPAPASPAQLTPASGRVMRAMLFADIKGFSRLTDEELPRFATHVLGAFADTLGRYSEVVEYQNTWGDALYVVLADAPAASACALDLQEAMSGLDLEAARLPAHLALRLGGHLGPVFPTWDPVLGELGFMGSHVSRTARIEPVTPPGAVYVTEPFASALALEGREEFGCDYVGHMPAAKDYGRLRMYRLWRSGEEETPTPSGDGG